MGRPVETISASQPEPTKNLALEGDLVDLGEAWSDMEPR